MRSVLLFVNKKRIFQNVSVCREVSNYRSDDMFLAYLSMIQILVLPPRFVTLSANYLTILAWTIVVAHIYIYIYIYSVSREQKMTSKERNVTKGEIDMQMTIMIG